MPFNCLESVSNAAHRALALLRIVLRLSPEHFIAVKSKAGLNLKTVADANGRPRLCQLCGFALAQCQLNEQWLMEACSAAGFKETRNQPAFADWLARLSDDKVSKLKLKNDQASDMSYLAEKSYTCH
jgi:hypothetical protein